MRNEIALKIEENTKTIVSYLKLIEENLFINKKDEHNWSVMETLEHLYITEIGILRIIQQQSSFEENYKRNLNDKILTEISANRILKIDAPSAVKPKGRFKGKLQALEMWEKNRLTIIDKVEHQVVFDDKTYVHPLLGEMTKTDWLLFMVSHAERHLSQMKNSIED